MASTFQSPPGTRDFYPDDMALRRFIEETWRRASVRHGFLEMDGPTFEYLDLYKIKSGDEIVSQLFHFESRGDKAGKTDEFALRPEFTPTLARMIAARANALPRPIKWFCIPRCFRAERQQKGRLKEFFQWNLDLLGGDTPEVRRQYDLEVVAAALDSFRDLGLSGSEIKLLWNDRALVEDLFRLAGVPAERFGFAFYLLDRVVKLSPDHRRKLYDENALTNRERAFFDQLAAGQEPLSKEFWRELDAAGTEPGAGGGDGFETYVQTVSKSQEHIERTLSLMGLGGYAKYDASIVRGLAYYTGFVFEVTDAKGENRAVMGGGRYDKLIEMFGGPSVPAVGFGMGDVVLTIILQELGKLPAVLGAKSDVFVINALPEPDESIKLIAALRAGTWDAASKSIARPGLNVGTSYKATKNIGKLLQEASASGAKIAVILAAAEWEKGVAKVKNLATREEKDVPAADLAAVVREMVKG